MVGTPLFWAGAGAALAAGAAGSLHCVLMCGPLACAPLGGTRGIERRRTMAAWHLGRLAAYTLVGAALGLAGAGFAALLAERIQPWLPWLMAVGLAATALELGRRLRPLPGIAGLSRRIARLGAGASPVARSLALGAATPLLPCGLLYGLFLAAVAAGSAAGGAAVMAAFGIGGVPGLAAVQLGATWSGRYPRVETWLRRAVPLAAAGVLVWRALAAPAAGAAPPAGH